MPPSTTNCADIFSGFIFIQWKISSDDRYPITMMETELSLIPSTPAPRKQKIWREGLLLVSSNLSLSWKCWKMPLNCSQFNESHISALQLGKHAIQTQPISALFCIFVSWNLKELYRVIRITSIFMKYHRVEQ